MPTYLAIAQRAAHFVKRPISECDSDNDGQSQTDLASVLVFLDLVDRRQPEPSTIGQFAATHKIDINLLDRTGPAIEPKDFVCKVDAFIRGEIVYFLSCGTGS